MSQHMPPPGQPAPPQEPRKGVEVGLLPFIASIVGLLLVAGIIGGVLWWTRDGGEEPGATTTGATQPDGAVIGSPTIELESDGDIFTYTVDYENYQEGDTYRLQKGPDEDSLDAAQPVTLSGGTTTHRSNVGEGRQECARVQVVRGGSQYSDWSKPKCERGVQ